MSEEIQHPHKVEIAVYSLEQYIKIRDWCYEHLCYDLWESQSWNTFCFTLEDDALMFKLTWGGE